MVVAGSRELQRQRAGSLFPRPQAKAGVIRDISGQTPDPVLGIAFLVVLKRKLRKYGRKARDGRADRMHGRRSYFNRLKRRAARWNLGVKQSV